MAAPRPTSAATSLALTSKDYPSATQVVVLPATNTEADRYFGPVHRSHFSRLHRVDGAGWMQAGLWHFKTGRGGAIRQHTTVFAYGIHVFAGRAVAHRALLDVKLKTHRTRVSHLYARRYATSDAQQTLVFLFFTYHNILVETYFEYGGVAPASVSTMLHKTFGRQSAHLAGLSKKLYKTIHKPPVRTALPTLTATSAPTATSTATPAATSTPTSEPTSVVIPTATIAPSATATASPTSNILTLQAQTTSPTYAPGEHAVVNVRVTKGGDPVAGVTVTVTFYLPRGSTICTGTTDANGDVTCSTGIQGDTPSGTVVDVIIGAQGPNNDTATLEISFTVK